MVGACVHVKLARHLLAEPIPRKHATYRATDDFLGSAREELLEGLGAQAAGAPRVTHVLLRLQLVSGHVHLRHVSSDHTIVRAAYGVDLCLVLPAWCRDNFS